MQNFAQYADWAYLIGAVLFILALRGLSSPSAAIMGNRYGMFGMALAVVATFAVVANLGVAIKPGYVLIFGAMIAGAVSIEEGNGSQASLVVVAGRADFAERLRDALEARGQRAVLIDDSLIPDAALTAVVRALHIAGVTAITARQLSADVLADVVRATQAFAEGEVVIGDGLEEDEILRLAGVRI